MEDNESQPLPDRKHRSFVFSDFSVRDIPFALLAFIIISVASVVLGPATSHNILEFCGRVPARRPELGPGLPS